MTDEERRSADRRRGGNYRDAIRALIADPALLEQLLGLVEDHLMVYGKVPTAVELAHALRRPITP